MNKKTIIFTVGIISAFIVLMVAGSKVFTGYMGYLDEAENTLTVDTENTDYETVFDYPYIKMSELEEKTDIPNYKCYLQIKMDVTTLQFRNLDMIEELEEGMITFQEVSNKCGEAFKYLYGITYHSNTPAMLVCHSINGVTRYLYYLPTEKQEEGGPYFRASFLSAAVDAYTGEIMSVSRNRYPITFEQNPDINYPTGTQLTDTAAQLLKRQLANDLDIIGYSEEIIYGKIEIAGNKGYYNYFIDYQLPDEVRRYAVYNTVDHSYFEPASILNHRVSE